ncbi:metal-dependent phosphohydrolase, partial [Actinoallomurus acaciae]
PDRYAAYAAAVREEYAAVPDEAFRAGRAEILRGLLALPALYRTAPARVRWEAAARHNVGTELMLLGSASGGAAPPG